MLSNRFTRTFAATMVLAIVATTLAPAAEAGRHKGRRYKDADDSRWARYEERDCSRGNSHRRSHGRGHSWDRGGHRSRVVEVRRSSGYVPALAGFLGGVAVGAVIARHANYSYYDSYCDRSYSSLDACGSHFRSCEHPRVVLVIDSSGGCVDSYRWQRSTGWVDDGDGWDDRDGDQSDDQGGCRN